MLSGVPDRTQPKGVYKRCRMELKTAWAIPNSEIGASFPPFPTLTTQVSRSFLLYLGRSSLQSTDPRCSLSLSPWTPHTGLTLQETEASCASSYKCSSGYRLPPDWKLSVGGVHVLPVHRGSTHRRPSRATTTSSSRRSSGGIPMVPRQHRDLDRLLRQSGERELVKYKGDGPPPVNHNEADRRLWWANRTV